MTTSGLAEKFVATFRRGIEVEKAALRADSSAYEVAVEKLCLLSEMTQGQRHYYSMEVPRPSERLSPGVQCSLREPSGLEVPVTLVQWNGPLLVVMSEVTISVLEGGYRLVFVPWFLYDEMSRALSEVAFPASALRTFGKLPVKRTVGEAVQFEHSLNEVQQRAVQQALESELTLLWGPPGTGKTTTLAELVSQLVRRQRRVLITSTTHAALDQVLEQLLGTAALGPVAAVGQILQLGFAGRPCSLDQVVELTQNRASLMLQRSLRRLEWAAGCLSGLLPVLAVCARAASQAQQLDLFAEPPGRLGRAELLQALPGEEERAARLAEATVEEQHRVLARRSDRLAAVSVELKRRVREARQALAEGQQQAVDAARILLTTLANSYVSPLLKDQEFDAVVIEEAGMALLPAVYLAAGRSRGQVVVVGDPQQLPAILASRDAFAQQSLGRNLFEVLGECEQRVMLEVQYRMHPVLGELVNQLFYGGGLRHAAPARVEEIAACAPFAGEALVLLDVPGEALTDPGDFSRYNVGTAERAVELAREAAAQGLSVAVMAPYRKQVARIQRQIQDLGLDEQVQCATVHRFQGHERDVVILDITDAPPLAPGVLLAGRGPGSNSANLLNVSISRASWW